MLNSDSAAPFEDEQASSSSTSAASIAIVVDNGEENGSQMEAEQGTPKEFTVDEIAASSREREFVNPAPKILGNGKVSFSLKERRSIIANELYTDAVNDFESEMERKVPDLQDPYELILDGVPPLYPILRIQLDNILHQDSAA